MVQFGMGQPVRRAEDRRFITGHGRYTDDIVLGIKGAGEAGAIGAPPAVINALVDALSDYGIEHIDMPATPERVWAAIQQARPARAA